MKKYLYSFCIIFSISFLFQGCGGLVLVSSALTGVMTAQELEEDYDGDIQYYIEDKANSTYEYIESKTSD